MKIGILSDIEPGNETSALSSVNYGEGFYIINDQLWLKDNGGLISFIWSDIQSYFSEPIENGSKTKEPERGDTISEEFLLKVLAVAKEPSLIKDI